MFLSYRTQLDEVVRNHSVLFVVCAFFFFILRKEEQQQHALTDLLNCMSDNYDIYFSSKRGKCGLRIHSGSKQ